MKDIVFRDAKFSDVESVLELINGYATAGLMLARSRNSLYENLFDFVLAEKDGKIIGVGALHFVWDELGEIRSLAVQEWFKNQGIGRKIVEILTEKARVVGVKRLFVLTYEKDFFAKLGFNFVSHESVPQKMWKECINCTKFPNCDEIAMELYL